jgi:uncharacterized membrane protein
MTKARCHLDRLTWMLLAVAGVWSSSLVVAAVTVPFYSGPTETGSTTVGGPTVTTFGSSTATFVAVNGARVLLPLSLPLVAVIVVAMLLLRRRARGAGGPGPWATGTVVLLGGLAFLAMWTIGPFVLPVVILLAIAVGRQRPVAPQAWQHAGRG